MHITVTGTGPALVMVHGWAMHSGIFALLRERLESRFTVHAVDLPGHGLSRASTVPLTLDAIARHVCENTPPALWLGWSLGGLVALHAAQAHRTCVRALVMIGASPRFVEAVDWPEGMSGQILSAFADQLGSDYRGTIDRFLMLQAHGSDHMRTELRMLRDGVSEQGELDPRVLARGLSLLHDSDLRAGLATLAMPSLWLAGRRDRLVCPQAMRRAAGLAPQAQFVQFDGGGHAPFLTHADEIERALSVFAEGVTA